MKFGKVKPKPLDVYQENLEGKVYLFCHTCGSVNVDAFVHGGFVLVSMQGRPFYGRVVGAEEGDQGPVVIVEIGAGDTQKISLDYISPILPHSSGK